MKTAPRRVLVVQTLAKVRARVRAALSDLTGYEVVAEASNSVEAVSLAKREQPDLAVLELAMSDGSGPAMLAEIRASVPGIGIVVYSRFPERETLALATGADAFSAHRAPTSALITALERAATASAAPERRLAATSGLDWPPMLDALAEGVIVRDARGVVVFSNAAAQEFFGIRERELAGKTPDEDPVLRWLRADGSILPGTELPGLVALRTGEPVRGTVVGVESSQRGVRWYSANAIPIAGTNGAPAGIVTAFSDITDGIAADRARREADERFQATVGAMFAGLAVYSARRGEQGEIVDLVCEYTNPAVEQNRGIAPAAQVGRGILELFPDLVELGLFQQYTAVIETGTPCRLTVPWFESDLVTGAFEISVAKLGDGCVMVFRDITDIARTEAALRRANDELSGFAAGAAHDLAEPVRVVAGLAGLLREHQGEQLDRQALGWLNDIATSANDMRAMISALLAYARTGAAPLAIESVDLAAVASAARSALEVALGDETVSIESLPIVAGDAVQLRRVMQNLLSNAAKFGRPATPPSIVVDAERVSDGWCVRVTDNGIGIAEEERERVFEAFHRLHSRDVIPGTGLGLATCRTIVERHGGRIWVDEAPGGGSRFCFVVPAVLPDTF